MRDNRVSCMPIERPINEKDEFTTKTIGLAFLTDLMFFFRVPNYYKYLDEPIINFVTDLNAIEEDNFFDQNSNSTHADSQSQPMG